MSVIYEALNKFKKPAGNKKKFSTSQGNVIIFEDLLKKNAFSIFFLLMLVVFAVAGGLYYLYQYDVIPAGTGSLAPKIHRVTNDSLLDQSTGSQSIKSASVPDMEEPKVAGAEEFVIEHISMKETPEEPSSFPAEITVDENKRLVATASTIPQETVKKGKGVPAIIHTQFKKTAGDKRQNVQTVLVVEDMIVAQSSVATSPEVKSISESGQQVRQSGGNSVDINRYNSSHPKKISNRIPHSANKETVATTVVNTQTQLQKNMVKNNKTDFNPAIQNLNRKLQESIMQQDFTTGSEIIKKLENFLGADSAYILKLKAYFYLQNNKIEQAHQLLSRIMDDNETDLEAGLNMIVVLVQQGRLKAAQSQVDFLLNHYPGNQTLLQFKQQIGN